MREMKNSGVEWIGAIPTAWGMQKAKYYIKSCDGGIWGDEPNETSNNIFVLRSTEQNIDGTWTIVDPAKRAIDGISKWESYLLHEGDLVITKSSGSPSHIGKTSIVTHEIEERVCAYSNFMQRIVTNKNLLPKLAWYFFNSDIVRSQFNFMSSTTSGINNINASMIYALWLPMIPLDCQNRITAYLDAKCEKIDAAIARQQDAVEKLKVFKQQLITETVRNGLHGEPLARSHYFWVGDVPQSWQVGQLKYFCSIRAGLTLGKKYPEGSELVEMPYLRVANVQGEYVDLSDVATVAVLPEEVEKYRLHPGELLMTEGGDRDKLGRGCVWNGEIDPCLHQNHVFAVTTDSSRLLAHFLDYVTTSDIARSYFDYTAKKTTNLASTNSTTIMQFRIPVPPVQEQQEIVDYLDVRCAKVNKAMEQRNAIIAKLNEYKKSLIYEVVTGKREV